VRRTIGKIWSFFWRAGLAVVFVGGALVWWMNRDTSWNAGTALAAPASVREPRVGVIIIAIAQPAKFETRFWQNATAKILDKVVPWPVNALARRDKGIVLFDPGHPYAPREFAPTRLADIGGREADAAGVPWTEHYRRGDLDWVEPNKSIPNDTGYFLYSGAKQGMPTVAAKTAGKARYLYYAPLRDGYLPHSDQARALARDAFALLRALLTTRYPQIVATGFASVFDPAEKEAAVRRVLDAGADVIVLGSGQPIYSDFEELRGSFSDVHKYVERWRSAHGNKPVRLAVAPWMATEPAFDDLWLEHFAETVPEATAPGQTALGIVSLHGLPVSLATSDSWSKRWPRVAARLKPRMAAIFKAKGYATTRVEVGSEAFADAIEDPNNQLLSVNELYREARSKRYALAIALPIEFLAENTDTLFAHQSLFFDGLAGYRTYAPPPSDTDWNKPYVRRLQDGATTIIYAGALGGAVQPRASVVLADAIGRVFPATPTGATR
jgi:hypothetical protein